MVVVNAAMGAERFSKSHDLAIRKRFKRCFFARCRAPSDARMWSSDQHQSARAIVLTEINGLDLVTPRVSCQSAVEVEAGSHVIALPWASRA